MNLLDFWFSTSFGGLTGLVLDMHLGNLLELSTSGAVMAAFHGGQELSSSRIQRVYGLGAVALVCTGCMGSKAAQASLVHHIPPNTKLR